jgi:hypothetical protein
MRHVGALGLVLVALGLVAPTTAQADEILDQINQAIAMYKSGDFAGAAGELEFAAAQIRQLRAGEIAKALPAPLAGWSADEAETAAMGASMFGGGTTASRDYDRDKARVSVQIVTDSPMLQSVAMMLNNPMIMSGSGQKLIRIKGNKASLEWNDDGGTINVVYQGRVLVTVEGRRCTQDDLTAYAEAVDYDLIGESLAK